MRVSGVTSRPNIMLVASGAGTCAPPHFGSKSTISRFGERFRDGQYRLVSFLFAVLLLTVPFVLSHL